MKWYLLAFLLSTASAQDPAKIEAVNNIFGGAETAFVPIGYELVTEKPLRDYAALPKCGEGEDKGRKVCISYHRCDPRTNTVTEEENTDGAGKIDIRAGVNECESYLDICCKLPEGNITTIPTRKPPVTETPVTPKPSFCGIRNVNGIDFTITGNTHNEAEYGEFPWMVAILKKNFNPKEPPAICGGSLISPIVVLTGAHCVYQYKANDIRIRAGEWDTQTTKERLPYQERDVSDIIIHRNFNSQNLHNDIALLILSTPVDKADNVGTICLPPQGLTFTSKNCFASGWGKTEFGNTAKYSVILKKIELPIYPKPQCQDVLRKTRLGEHFILDKSFICAGGEKGKDTCTGDGGSPLACPDPNNPGRYLQAGLVGWGIGCGEDRPGVYADIAYFRNWVDAQLERLNIDTRPYTS